MRKCKQAKRVRRSRGSLFVGAALLLLFAVPTVATLTYFAHAYVTKARLGDSAQVIARAIQDDPTITQSFVNGVADGFNGNLGELEKVVSAAAGVPGDGVPAGFNVAKFKECNPDIAGLTNNAARRHFARAG